MTAIVGSTPSGGDYLIQDLASALGLREVEITVVAAESSIEHLRTEFRDRWISIPGKLSNGDSVIAAYLARSFRLVRIFRRVTRSKPDIVVSGSVFLPDLVAALLYARTATVWVLSWQLDLMPPTPKYFRSHSLEGSKKLLQGIRTSISFACQELALSVARRREAVLAVPSQELKERAKARGFSESAVVICGATLERPVNRASPQYEHRQTDFLFLGRFHAQKGLTDLLDAWDYIREALPHARLKVAGGGDGLLANRFLDEMKRRAESIEFVGVVKGDTKWNLLYDTRVVLFPSTYESLGIVALEACAAGAVVVGYRISSTSEAFGDGVIQVPLSEPQLLARAAVEAYQDQNLWATQQRIGFKVIDQYLSRDAPDSAALAILTYAKSSSS